MVSCSTWRVFVQIRLVLRHIKERWSVDTVYLRTESFRADAIKLYTSEGDVRPRWCLLCFVCP